MSENPQLRLHVWYQNMEATVEHNANDMLVIGRKFLQTLFGVRGSNFRNISRTHLTIFFDDITDQFWAKDSSLLGTFVRVVGSAHDSLGPEFLYHHDQFLVKRHMRLRMQNEDASREPDDIIIEIENHSHDETRPILHAPSYWDRLLKQLHNVRAAHLVGMPGTGKSTLAKKLLAPNGTMWQRQRDRQLGGRALVAWVDCHMLNERDGYLWQRLAQRMLSALHTAADDQFLTEMRDEIARSLKTFNQSNSQRIGQITPVFRQALRTVVRHGFRPVFVFDHFDDVYTRLNKFMLYQLYQFHQWPDIGEALRYVVITRRPLEALRSDRKENGVVEFYNTFSRYSIHMRCWDSAEFKTLWRQVAPGHGDVNDAALSHLYKLCGGHPRLARELYEELAINDWLEPSDWWHKKLTQVNWEERPARSCIITWDFMTSAEKQAIVNLLHHKEVDGQQRNALISMGILNQHGNVYSPLFARTVQQFSQEIRQRRPGLIVDVPNRRVFVNGNDVTSKLQGRKLDVLIYMYQNANRLVDYEELIEHTLPKGTAIDQIYIESERGALQRTVSRLCKIADPNREHIHNEQGQGYILRYEQPQLVV